MNTEQQPTPAATPLVELLPLQSGGNDSWVKASTAPTLEDETERRTEREPEAERVSLLPNERRTESEPQAERISLLPKERVVHGPKTEPTKQLIQNAWKHLGLQVGIHFLPIASSCVLLWLNSTQHFWFELQATVALQFPTHSVDVSVNTILHVMQIAAKVYELLVLLSMSAILLDIFRTMLVGDGIPFGLITSGYQVGSLAYLTNSGLMSALSTSSTGLACLTIFITLLSLAVGPAAAILLVPSPGWWASVSFHGARVMSLYSLGGDGLAIQLERWPTKLDFGPQAFNEDLARCLSSYPPLYAYCPGFDVDQITDRVWTNINASQVSVTVPASWHGVPRWLRSARIANQEKQLTIATTLPYSSTEAISAATLYAPLLYEALRVSDFSQVETAKTDKSYQPVVQIECNVYDWIEARDAFNGNKSAGIPSWPIGNIDCFDDEICAAWQRVPDSQRVLGQSFWSSDPAAGKRVSFQWLNESQTPLSAVFKIPQNVNLTQANTTQTNFSSDWTVEGEGQWLLGACTLVPRWFPSSMTMTLGQSVIIQSNATDFGGLNETILDSGPWGLPLQATPAWAELLNIKLNETIDASSPWSIVSNESYNILEGTMAGLVSATIEATRNDSSVAHLTLVPDRLSTIQAIEAMVSLLVVNGISRSTMSNQSVLLFMSLERNNEQTTLMGPAESEDPSQYETVTITSGNASCPLLVKFQLPNGETSHDCDNGTIDQSLSEILPTSKWDIEVEKIGYGSGLSSPTLTFSLVMVCLYLAFVGLWIVSSIIYQFLLSWNRNNPSGKMGVTGWGNLQDLVALAWTSKPPNKIHNVGARVKPFSYVWKQTVMVRVNDQNCLQLVEDDSQRMKRAEKGALYS